MSNSQSSFLQLELLQKATLTITHAGMNTTLECLNNAVPMVAIPIAFDQPGVAARIAWSGAGEAIPLKRLTVARLRKAISKVLTQPSYKQNALRLQSAIQRSGGVTRAATPGWSKAIGIATIGTALFKHSRVVFIPA
ncbi:glycosyltransferase [Okeania hirsuta]|uniref:glycosyltransferase n=1 Tax=Okeania hirsuta TaxID=1458930 RepID=UPI0026BD172A